MHLVRGANPLKPLIFYIPHGNSPCFGTYHLEIPHEKSILVWYFPMYKMKYIFNKKSTKLFPTTFPHVLASFIWKFLMKSPFWHGISPLTLQITDKRKLNKTKSSMPKFPITGNFKTHCFHIHSMYRFPYHKLSSVIISSLQFI